VLVAQFHSSGGPFIMTAQAHRLVASKVIPAFR
jgi:hypothetical protein